MRHRGRANRFAPFTWLLIMGSLFLKAPSAAFAFDKEIKTLVGEITLKVSAAQKGRIAVVDFTDLQGNVNELGRFLAEQLSGKLSEAATSFQVIDRGNLANLLREHNLSASSLFDMQTTRQLGKLSGVSALITGSITPFGDSVKVTLKIIDTDTAKMIGSSSEDIARSNTIDYLLKQGVGGVAGPAGAAGPLGSANYSNPSAGNASPIVAEQNKFTFELQACELSGENISCNLLVKNSAKSRALTVKSSTMLFDDQGNQYFPSSGQIANSLQAFNDHCCDSVRMTLVNEVPVPMSISFQGIAPQAAMVSLLTLDCTDGENANFKVSFRNVSIAQKTVAGIDKSMIGTSMGLSSSAGPGAAPQTIPTVKGIAKNFLKKGLEQILDRSLLILDKKITQTVDKVVPPPN